MTLGSAARARARMVDRLSAERPGLTPRVLEAMAAVPRHRFVPSVGLTAAYANRPVVTRRAPDGTAMSSASAPDMVALMLDQLNPQPGDRILEVGAGTGYNAALLSFLVAPSGRVCTVDIDPDVAAQAAAALRSTGFDRVHVAAGDGSDGDSAHAPYDGIIVTAGAWDLPPAWWSQLTAVGRLVVPLRWRGQTRCVAFDRTGVALLARSMVPCGFIPLIGHEGEWSGSIDPSGVTLHGDADQAIELSALNGVLRTPRTVRWTGDTVSNHEAFDGIWLRLSASDPGTCRIEAGPSAVRDGLCTPALGTSTAAVVEGSSLAYLTLRPHLMAPDQVELGAIGHGAAGPALADRIATHISAWSRARSHSPAVTAYPAGTADAELPAGLVIEKRATRLVLAS